MPAAVHAQHWYEKSVTGAALYPLPNTHCLQLFSWHCIFPGSPSLHDDRLQSNRITSLQKLVVFEIRRWVCRSDWRVGGKKSKRIISFKYLLMGSLDGSTKLPTRAETFNGRYRSHSLASERQGISLKWQNWSTRRAHWFYYRTFYK